MTEFKATHYISQNYRGRWSEKPEGEYDLLEGEHVQMVHNSGLGSIIVKTTKGEEVPIAGFSGYILRSLWPLLMQLIDNHYPELTGLE